MWHWRPARRGPVLGLWLGLVAGGVESVGIALLTAPGVSLAEGLMLGLLSVVCGGVLGVAAGTMGGLVADGIVRWPKLPARHSASMAVAGFVLSGWWLWPAAMFKLGQGLPIPALALGVTPVGFGGVVYFNAHYWLRREELGEDRRFGWTAASALVGLLLGLGGGAWLGTSQQGSSQALESDPDVVLITVDHLSRTDLNAFVRETMEEVETPTLSGLTSEGVRFHQAISPMPETGPAHAALLTGRHPARMGVWSDEHALGRVWPTLPDVLRREGYATGAFVSSAALGTHLGLDRGFGVYDDSRLPAPFVAGSEEVALVRRGVEVLSRLVSKPAHWPSLNRRSDEETAERAARWMVRHADRPRFVWVQLSGGDPSDRPAAMAALDAQVSTVLRSLSAGDNQRDTLVVFTGIGAGDRATGGVSEERVVVPLVIVPRKMRVVEPDVMLAVRLMDVPQTILDQLGLDVFDNVDGSDLAGFAEGTKSRGYATMLAARVAAESGPPTLELGYRAGRKGTDAMVKLQLDPVSGEARFFDLGDDPRENVDVSLLQQEATAELARQARAEAGEAGEGTLPPGTASPGLTRVLRDARFGAPD